MTKKKNRVCWGNNSETQMDTCFSRSLSRLKVDYMKDRPGMVSYARIFVPNETKKSNAFTIIRNMK